jgi:hypothetical protein
VSLSDQTTYTPREAEALEYTSSFGTGDLPFRCDKVKGVKVFWTESEWESITIHPEPERYPLRPSDRAEQAATLNEAVILVDGPHLRPARVIAVVDGSVKIPPRAPLKLPGLIISNTHPVYRRESGIDLGDCSSTVMAFPVCCTNLAQTRIG